MIAVDTNVLVYAHRADTDHHERGLRLVTEQAEGLHPWGLPVFVLNEFLRVVTHPRVFTPPTRREAAMDAVAALLASPTVQLLRPGARFWPLLAAALRDGEATGNLVHDAAIVAVCIEHGADTIITADRGLRRFSSIAVRPL